VAAWLLVQNSNAATEAMMGPHGVLVWWVRAVVSVFSAFSFATGAMMGAHGVLAWWVPDEPAAAEQSRAEHNTAQQNRTKRLSPPSTHTGCRHKHQNGAATSPLLSLVV
jgi:hypothetical protein